MLICVFILTFGSTFDCTDSISLTDSVRSKISTDTSVNNIHKNFYMASIFFKGCSILTGFISASMSSYVTSKVVENTNSTSSLTDDINIHALSTAVTITSWFCVACMITAVILNKYSINNYQKYIEQQNNKHVAQDVNAAASELFDQLLSETEMRTPESDHHVQSSVKTTNESNHLERFVSTVTVGSGTRQVDKPDASHVVDQQSEVEVDSHHALEEHRNIAQIDSHRLSEAFQRMRREANQRDKSDDDG